MTWFFFQKGLFDLFFLLILLLVFLMIVFVLGSCLNDWKRNNDTERVDIQAVVKAKRLRITVDDIHHSARYYVTFETADGERMELMTSGREYRGLEEGDTGILSFQGSRYISFFRK